MLKLNFSGVPLQCSAEDNKCLSQGYISGCLDSVAGCRWQPLAPRVLIQALLNHPPTLLSVHSSFSSSSFPPPRADPSPAVRGLRVVDLAFLCSLMKCLMSVPFGVRRCGHYNVAPLVILQYITQLRN